MNFRDALKAEKYGMERLVSHITSRPTVEDVVQIGYSSNFDKMFQHKFGDLLLVSSGKTYALEVKFDSSDSPNFFLEMWSDVTTLRQGWLQTTESDYILYYFINQGVMYTIGTKALKEWAFAQKQIYRYKLQEQKAWSQTNITQGFIVPIKDIHNYSWVVKETIH